MLSAFVRRATIALAIATYPFISLASECDQSSYKDVLLCISKSAPEILHANIETQIAESDISKARQIPNPELEARNLWEEGKSANTEAKLLLPLEIAGQRGARSDLAKAERDIIAAKSQASREQTLTRTARSLHRLRQIETEIFLANEAIERFEKIVSTFKKRPQLSPEQSVSLTVIKYALEEEKQKKAEAVAEQSSIVTELSVMMGSKLKVSKNIFPSMPNKWPSFKAQSVQQSAEVKYAQARARQGQAQLRAAQAESWPALRVGPAYERQGEGNQVQESFGVGVSLELPLFNLNGGGRKSASLAKKLGELEAQAGATNAAAKLESLIEQYSIITQALASIPSQTELEKGHRAFEAQFNRGLVSYGLIIEAHRQMHETVETKHRQELNALNLLWNIYQLTGQLNVETL